MACAQRLQKTVPMQMPLGISTLAVTTQTARTVFVLLNKTSEMSSKIICIKNI